MSMTRLQVAIFNYNAPSNQWLIEEHLEFGMLPIGKNDFGDYVMLGVSGRKKGKIFLKSRLAHGS